MLQLFCNIGIEDGYSELSDAEIDAILSDILSTVDCGETYVIGALKGAYVLHQLYNKHHIYILRFIYLLFASHMKKFKPDNIQISV